MRSIKFRAWDKVTKQMSDEFVLFGEFTLMGAVHAWQYECAANMPDSIKFDSLGRLNDLEIMQYTGLKDKNGKEIYEGDLVQSDERKTSIGEVVFDAAEFKLKMVYFKRILWKLKYKNTKKAPEVIGNIYENPGLL